MSAIWTRFVMALALAASVGCAPMLYGEGVRSPVAGNIFHAGEPAQLAVLSLGGGAAWRVTDAWGAVRLEGEAPGGVGIVDVSDLPPGYYELRGEAEALRHPTSFAIIERPIARDPATSTFGVQTHFAQGWSLAMLDVLERLGVMHVRDELYWSEVERRPGRVDPPRAYDAFMAGLKERAITPLIILSYANRHYDDGDTPHTDEGRAAFARYGVALARRYGDQLPALEVWNEYNGDFCSGPACRGDRTESYAFLLKDAAEALREEESWEGTILGGAAVRLPVPYLNRLFERGALEHMDGVVIHPYGANPDTIHRGVKDLRAAMAANGDERPIWITEWGRRARSEDDRLATARYLAQMSIIFKALEIERAYWYLLRDYTPAFTGFGLVRSPDSAFGAYSPTPAAPAFANITRHLEGAAPICRLQLDPRTYAYVFETGQGEPLIAAWSQHDETTLRVQAPSQGEVRGKDLFGAPVALEPSEGAAGALALTADPVFLTGPITAIEDLRADRVLAHSVLDFDPSDALTVAERDAPPQPGWRYGPARLNDARGPFVMQSAHRYESDWRIAVASEHASVFALSQSNQHPSRGADRYAVRRWTPDRFARGTARLTFTNAGDRGDGVEALVAVGGRIVWRSRVPSEESGRTVRADVPFALQPGESLDIAVGPGPDGDANFDNTFTRATLLAPTNEPIGASVCSSSDD